MGGPGGMDPRQMAMMMRKLGIESRDIDDVKEVIVRTRDREYRFAKPQVSVLKAQGSETWQVLGRPQVTELGPKDAPKPAPVTPPAPTGPTTIPDEDVAMVVEQTDKDPATARRALEATHGDIAEAIVRLS
jgi:nascent polypeptide-associated complex subunit alpha